MPLRGACGQPLKVHDENVNTTEHTEHAKSDLISDCAQAWSFLTIFEWERNPRFQDLLLSGKFFSPPRTRKFLPRPLPSTLPLHCTHPVFYLQLFPTSSTSSNHSKWILAQTGLATTVRFFSYPPASLAYPPPHSASSLLR